MQQYNLLNIHFLFFLCVLTLSCNLQNKETQKNSYTIDKSNPELSQQIWKIYQDQEENYWFGSDGNGVFHYDGKHLKQYTQKDGLIDNNIRRIQGDKLGNIFIGTPEGVSKFDGKTFTTLSPIISASNEWKLEPDDLWFNCNGNALYRYDGKSLFELTLPRKDLAKAFGTEVVGVSFENMNNSPYAVYGIDKDKAGNLWLGTVTAGVFRFDGESFLWIAEKELSTLPDGRVPGVRSMLEDKDGNFWLSNFISKYKITSNDATVKYQKLEGIAKSTKYFEDRLPYFNSGLSDKKGNLWMTTYGGGVWKYDGKTLLNFPIKNGDTEVLLVSIYEDHKGDFWLGTNNDGVYKSNGERFEKFEPITK